MISRVLFGVAIALSTAVSTADPIGAEPSPFSVLSCSCDGNATFLPKGTPSEQIDSGIQNGLTDLLGDAG